MTTRHALYFAPAPGSAWWQAGSQWLGRCAATGQALAQPTVPDIPPDTLARLTATPARYGWHATLKAPFVLAPGTPRGTLGTRLAVLCQQFAAFELPPLTVTHLGNFLALVPASESSTLQSVANACVTQLHDLAAPLPPAELARRRQGGLNTRQDELLQTWGYPHVLEQFRFHFSLTGPLTHEPPEVCEALRAGATAWFAALPACPFDAVSVFVEPASAQPMRWEERCALAPHVPTGATPCGTPGVRT